MIIKLKVNIKLINIGMKLKQLIAPNQSDIKARAMTYPNVYAPENRGIGKKSGVTLQTVIVRDSKTGQVYGRRTIPQK